LLDAPEQDEGPAQAGLAHPPGKKEGLDHAVE
jgi:hypothetical protein